MKLQGGAAVPVYISNRQVDGGAAIPVYIADDSRGIEGGSAIPVVFVDESRGIQGGSAIPVYIVDNPKRIQGGKAIPICIVSGRSYPLFFDVRNTYIAGVDYAAWMAPRWKSTDFAACKITAGTGDVTPLDSITFPCRKMSATTITRADTTIANVVAEALAHGCTYVGLNYEEAVSAATMVGYWEADQPVVVAAGLKCVCIPATGMLIAIMANPGLAARMIAVTDFIFIQTQLYQDDPDDGTYAIDVAAVVTSIRARTPTMPILIQESTEKPLAGSSADSMISQAKSVQNLNLWNGGFAVFCSGNNWTKAQTVLQTIEANVKSFAT